MSSKRLTWGDGAGQFAFYSPSIYTTRFSSEYVLLLQLKDIGNDYNTAAKMSHSAL